KAAVSPREEDTTFTRRIAAVLLADVSGFSALMGEDDERTARAVQHLRNIVQEIVADTRGHAEPVAGDALFATFDNVVAAVEAGLRIQERLAIEDFEGRRLELRIGVHVGDLLLREGAAFGDAINVASRLQSLARPGTICISDHVYRHVHNRLDVRFEDLGRHRLRNISHPVHAYLVLPHGARGQRRMGRAPVVWAAGVLALVAAAGTLATVYLRRAPAQPSALPAPVATAGEPGAPAADARSQV